MYKSSRSLTANGTTCCTVLPLSPTLVCGGDPGWEMSVPLRFHWRSSLATRPAEVSEFVRLCEYAEDCGIESVLWAGASAESSDLSFFESAGRVTRKVKFMVPCGTDLGSPALLVEQINRASKMLRGRILIHVAVDQALPDDIRRDSMREEERVDAFLSCLRTSLDRGSEIFLDGDSTEAALLAIQHADCVWRLPSKPEEVLSDALPILHMGKEVGLRASIVARPSSEEALKFAATVLPDGESTDKKNDSAWITPYLWAGALPHVRRASAALVGSFEVVAEAITMYREKGISQFLLGGWQDRQEMAYFGEGVLPLVRKNKE
jgi:alkanesulfonate monooxygenase SsuD/methylene tetrahydromethanopterin reductase-like flavin-dependent oxidoreductase (luciferase family)